MFPLQIGKKYLVKCVREKYTRRFYDKQQTFSVWIPILDIHDDDDGSGLHYHVDPRFLSNSFFRYILNCEPCELWTLPISGDIEIEYKERTCLREFPVAESLLEMTCFADEKIDNCFKEFLENFQNSMKERKMNKEELVCPHLGCRLDQTTPTEIQGKTCLVCPCHGLAWSLETGNLVERPI